MHKILLTGATGFIGSNILDRIKKNNKVFVIQRHNSKKKISKTKNIKILKFNNYNLLSKQLAKIEVDTIINCATHYKKEHETKDIFKFIESNILLGNIILENIKKLKAKKFINFSTTWENIEKKKLYPKNLYAAYKKGFNDIVDYYKYKLPKIEFFNLILMDTFGKNDNRNKLINTLKNNYYKNKKTIIVSKNLYLNLLNIEDIILAVEIILKKNIQAGQYILKNSKYFNIYKIISSINKNNNKKLYVEWLSNKFIKDETLNYKKLKSWKPKKSNIKDVKNLILN